MLTNEEKKYWENIQHWLKIEWTLNEFEEWRDSIKKRI
jgi:hypothetical protein